jgi:REP element-mobilizing transposase RayT
VSRLRRLVLSDRFFFVTCRLLPRRGILSESEFICLARAIHRRRARLGFLLTAWVLLPDHWHPIVFPRHPLTISAVMESIKVSSTKLINREREGQEPQSLKGANSALPCCTKERKSVPEMYLAP